ncbi:MAG: PmoA family protein [Candidatus Sumerlaeia bacterium]|nr:PmoA family protein [Candidatus Sumerlaeia bacterium]
MFFPMTAPRIGVVCFSIAALLCLSGHALPAAPESSAVPPALAAQKSDDAIAITVGGKPFTTYRFAATQKYPYFFPVCGPRSDRSLTTESSEPWPHHHSLFFGCDKVNKWNFWQEANERGQIVSRGPVLLENGPARVRIEDTCDWRPPAPNSPVMTEHRQIFISAPSDSLRFIDFTTTLTANEDIKIEKTNHSLFAVRMARHLGADRTGTMVNAEGLKGEKATFGKKSAWMDYYGDNGAGIEGIAIFDHPSNRWFPCEWFTRDYGFISPTPMNWLDENGFQLKRGETLTLRYRVVVHAGDPAQARLAELFKEWEKTK